MASVSGLLIGSNRWVDYRYCYFNRWSMKAGTWQDVSAGGAC